MHRPHMCTFILKKKKKKVWVWMGKSVYKFPQSCIRFCPVINFSLNLHFLNTRNTRLWECSYKGIKVMCEPLGPLVSHWPTQSSCLLLGLYISISISVCVCVCVYMYICIYMCIYIYIYIYVCICVYMCVCMYVCMYIYIMYMRGREFWSEKRFQQSNVSQLIT